ncbi:hypothetical protein [Nostoc favosum]|uniref:Uncharacterized protein n=1 Tax=Nostoc favosum CHAB5714 TaxID=2780399 RepID=A0ABS8IEI3_9NOSO|nr:hypothetical protein [Nostoc favosum]MCC5602174.1 hypothetical protein [Nostoc favosum CHAB5714]
MSKYSLGRFLYHSFLGKELKTTVKRIAKPLRFACGWSDRLPMLGLNN